VDEAKIMAVKTPTLFYASRRDTQKVSTLIKTTKVSSTGKREDSGKESFRKSNDCHSVLGRQNDRTSRATLQDMKIC